MSGTARARAVALLGIDGHLVDVEADVSLGLPTTTIVGVPDTALSEARDRVRAAVRNSGLEWPGTRVTLNLTPAALPKRGSGYDLACAAAVLRASGVRMDDALLEGSALSGELGLDGRVRGVPGALAVALACRRHGLERLVTARADAGVARAVTGVRVTGVDSLRELVEHLRGRPVPDDAAPAAPEPGPAAPAPDLSDVVGQAEARHALEVAAAGGHHLLLVGPPGAGKTMLAERLPGLLPPLDEADALEVGAVHGVAGRDRALSTVPPFESAHHTATPAALVGGGSGTVRPGLVSLAHRGVLFLDEAPELRRDALEALRQPLGDGEVVVVRSGVQQRFPSRFQLVMAANPCPCALGSDGGRCRCTAAERRRYQARLSGPLLDRVDLRVEVRPVSPAAFAAAAAIAEPSAVVRQRVLAARERAAARLRGTPWRRMADVPGAELRARWRPEPAAMALALQALERGELTARGLDRVVRVAWTLADLRAAALPAVDDVAGALALRGGTPPPDPGVARPRRRRAAA